MKRISAAILTLLVLLPLIAAGISPERQRKADYYFMESLARDAAGEGDASFLLLQRAVELDSVSSTEPGSILGSLMLGMSRGDSALYERGRSLLERHVAAKPSDLYAAFNLAVGYESTQNTPKLLETWRMIDSLNPGNSAVVWRRAFIESRYGSLDEAIRLIERYEKLERMSSETVLGKTAMMLQSADTARAEAAIDSMLALMPADADARVVAASFYEAIGRGEKADAYIDEALRLDPSNGSAYYHRARRYHETERTDEYFAEIANALKFDDLDRESKFGLLNDWLSEFGDSTGYRDRTEQLIGSLLNQYSHDEELSRFVSGYYVSIKDFGRAAEQFSHVADMNHDDPDLWVTMAQLYAAADSMPKSIGAARRGLGYFPDNTDLHRMLGLALTQNGDHTEAIAELRKAIELTADPREKSEFLTSIADVWQLMEQPDSATACYEQALALDPDNDLALNNYAYFLADRNRELARAEQMSSRSMLLRPGLATYLDTYAWIQFRLGNYQQAKEYIDTALLRSADDLSAELLEHAGDISYMNGRAEQALDYWKEALELDPENETLKRKVETGKIE